MPNWHFNNCFFLCCSIINLICLQPYSMCPEWSKQVADNSEFRDKQQIIFRQQGDYQTVNDYKQCLTFKTFWAKRCGKHLITYFVRENLSNGVLIFIFGIFQNTNCSFFRFIYLSITFLIMSFQKVFICSLSLTTFPFSYNCVIFLTSQPLLPLVHDDTHLYAVNTTSISVTSAEESPLSSKIF